MDLALLTFFNQTIANPLLDWIMIGATTIGFALLPAIGVALLLTKTQRETGLAILWALAGGFVLVLTFQFLSLRPRPEVIREILTQPNFPSYPSGHATAAFSTAMVIALGTWSTARRWQWLTLAFAGAILIALSRVYLGHHYPSDIFGGAVFGMAIGLTCYGIVRHPMQSPPPPAYTRWQWVLWLQVAVAIVVTQMAYLAILPWGLLAWPFADKVLHFVLIGLVAFWLNFWFKGRKVYWGTWAIPLAIIIPLLIALTEEGFQMFSPNRTASVEDLLSDIAGLIFFWWVSQKIIESSQSTQREPQRIGHTMEPDHLRN
ncbi:MAG: VanZ family protein [Chloroflexota bacterium]